MKSSVITKNCIYYIFKLETPNSNSSVKTESVYPCT